MISWFSTRELKQFAVQAIDDFELLFPVDTAAQATKHRKQENKRQKAVRQLLKQVTDYQRTHRLWFYKKAKLCKLIQNELEARNYPTELVDELANDLVFRVTAGIKRPI